MLSTIRYRGAHRASALRPSLLAGRTPGYVGIRLRPEAARTTVKVTESDTTALATVRA